MNAPWPHYRMGIGCHADFIQITQPGGLAEQFFAESEFAEFTEFDPDRFRETCGEAIRQERFHLICAYLGQEIVGFICFDISRHYTKDFIAYLFLLYCLPEHRRTPLGRGLINAASMTAKEHGAKAFYCGSTAGISPVNDRTFMNMLARCGFEALGGFARKRL